MIKQAVTLLLLLFFSLTSIAHAGDIPPGIITPTPFKAPALTVNDIDGNPFSLQAQKGKWVFVHFWASWCGPCRREVPAINKMQQSIQAQALDKKLAIAFINTAESEDTIFSFLSVYGPDLRALMDSDGLATEQWHPRGLPATYLVDPDGMVRYQALGGRPWHNAQYMKFLLNLVNTK